MADDELTTKDEAIMQQNAVKRNKKPVTGEKNNHQIIEHQIEAFLKSGGKIQRIPSGVSGQPSLAARRSLTISEKAPGERKSKVVNA